MSEGIKSVLITGATGAIGPRIVYEFYNAGYRIRTFSMDKLPPGTFPPDVEVLIGDVTNSTEVALAVQGMDAVVHMAALLHILNPPPGLRDKYEHINVGGTAVVTECAAVADVRRVVLFSTIAVYGQANQNVLNEQSPARPETFYASTKLAAERIVLDSKCRDGRPMGSVLRLGAVYGSRIKGNYERLTRALARNRFIPVGQGLNQRTLVYDRDVGQAVKLAVSHPAAAGRVFNVTDGKFHTLSEIIEAICNALGRKPPRFALPESGLRIAAGILEKGAELLALKAPISRQMLDRYTENIAVDGSLIQKEMGFEPQYDLDAGWREAIIEMRKTGTL